MRDVAVGLVITLLVAVPIYVLLPRRRRQPHRHPKEQPCSDCRRREWLARTLRPSKDRSGLR